MTTATVAPPEMARTLAATVVAHAEGVATAELERMRRRLAGLEEHQWAVVEELAHGVAAALVGPVVAALVAASPEQAQELVEVVDDLFFRPIEASAER